MVITDTENNEISYISQTLAENTTSPVFVIRVPATEDSYLTASANSTVHVLARLNGTSDAFQNIAANPIDLTPFDGEMTDFDVKVDVGNISSPIQRFIVPVKVTSAII